jgi:hypothetical protein
MPDATPRDQRTDDHETECQRTHRTNNKGVQTKEERGRTTDDSTDRLPVRLGAPRDRRRPPIAAHPERYVVYVTLRYVRPVARGRVERVRSAFQRWHARGTHARAQNSSHIGIVPVSTASLSFSDLRRTRRLDVACLDHAVPGEPTGSLTRREAEKANAAVLCCAVLCCAAARLRHLTPYQ